MKKISTFALSLSLALVGFTGAAWSDHHKEGHTEPKKMEKQADKDLVEVALAAGKFQVLAAALGEAELLEALKGEGPFTVFAPTDQAFGQLPPEMLQGLLADKAKLREVLMYHVVSGAVSSDQAARLTEAKSLAGKDFQVSLKDKQLFVNQSKVTKADIQASNGVIHVIDKVMLPPVK